MGILDREVERKGKVVVIDLASKVATLQLIYDHLRFDNFSNKDIREIFERKGLLMPANKAKLIHMRLKRLSFSGYLKQEKKNRTRATYRLSEKSKKYISTYGGFDNIEGPLMKKVMETKRKY